MKVICFPLKTDLAHEHLLLSSGDQAQLAAPSHQN